MCSSPQRRDGCSHELRHTNQEWSLGNQGQQQLSCKDKQAQTATPEQNIPKRTRTIACSKLTKNSDKVIYKDHILHMLHTIIAVLEVCNLLLINVQSRKWCLYTKEQNKITLQQNSNAVCSRNSSFSMATCRSKNCPAQKTYTGLLKQHHIHN